MRRLVVAILLLAAVAASAGAEQPAGEVATLQPIGSTPGWQTRSCMSTCDKTLAACNKTCGAQRRVNQKCYQQCAAQQSQCLAKCRGRGPNQPNRFN